MKLFEVSYITDEADFVSWLIVGEDKETAYKNELKKLNEDDCYPFSFNINEITEVDGYKIKLEEND